VLFIEKEEVLCMNNNNVIQNEWGLGSPNDVNAFNGLSVVVKNDSVSENNNKKKSSKKGNNKNTNKNNDKEVKYDAEGNEHIVKASWLNVTSNGKMYVHKGKLAEFIIKKYKAIYATGQFYFYSNGYYREAKQNEELGIIKSELGIEFSTMDIIRDAANQWKIDDRVNKFQEDLNPNPNILNLKNGLYNIKTKELQEHTPEYISTLQLDANYDINAKGENFMKFLNQAIPDKNLQMVLQEMAGYCLTTYTNSRKMFFFLLGEPGSGKSTFLEAVINGLIPQDFRTAFDLQELDVEHNKADLFGKTVNTSGDISDKPLEDVGFFKKASGGDPISARRKFGHPFNFYNKAKFVFSMNNLPPNYSKDKTAAFYERITIIPFNNPVAPDKRDLSLLEKLALEKDFILMWALEGLDRLISKGFKFTESEVAEKELHEYRYSNNISLQFLDEYIEVTGDKKDKLNASRVNEMFKYFCLEVLENDKIKNTQKIIEKELSRLGIEKKKDSTSGGKRFYYGIKLKEVEVDNTYTNLKFAFYCTKNNN
jgi:putative DNA primase/helicase